MRTVFFDVDTQIDFVFPAGALYVPGAASIVPVVARLNRAAAAAGLLVISTVDAHPENDGEFIEYAAHCIGGAAGQRKPAATCIVPAPVTVGERAAPVPALAGARQIQLEKTTVDCFRNRNLGPLLDALAPEHAVVYGVATEVAVRHAAMGLLARGCGVTLVTDAVSGVNAGMVRHALAEMARHGAGLADSATVLQSLAGGKYQSTLL
ncbi:MAG: cysteine hydrolase [Bryobacterales bacterium]|nr:cysteine hydrolase [Bryobacterales bacterium]